MNDGEKDRRGRLLEILNELAEVYAIAVLASAFLSNHFHLVLVNLPELVDQWSDREVMLRAQRAYPSRFKTMGITGPPTDEQMVVLLRKRKLIKEFRRRLSDISWMMRMLKQRFAAEVNSELGETGHFWEGRFKLIEILSEAQLVATMIYVSLNQIRAGEASTLDTSFWTSVCWQLQARQSAVSAEMSLAELRAGHLAPLGTDHAPKPKFKAGTPGSYRASDTPSMEMSLDEFVRLAQCAYELSEGKRAKPTPSVARSMERVQLSQDQLVQALAGIL
ncbi:MAG: hypothetical protein KDB14_15745 [Planctomycetales bacterium]|nr:hypothetical protein [Planctomycetales bacterium]